MFDLQNSNTNPGDALRNQAANFLAAKFGAAQTEKRVSGKKADIFFMARDFGKTVKIYVEVKDYSAALGRDQVVNIWSDYSGIIEKSRPSTLLLITSRGLTSDAQAYVEEQSSLRHMTIWELENEVLGLTDYVRSLTPYFDEDGLRQYYIPGRARTCTYDPQTLVRSAGAFELPIFEELIRWIDAHDPAPIAILGGYGAGKTSLAKRLISHQAVTALADPRARRPILVKLGSIARHQNLEGLLGAMFTSDHIVEGYNYSRFIEFNEKGRFLIVLDGFDEMKHAMTWADFRSQVAELNRLIAGEAKVVLMGRPSAFLSHEEHVHVLKGRTPIGKDWREVLNWPDFQEYDLQSFTPEERALFVANYMRYVETARNARAGRPPDESWIEKRSVEINALASRDEQVFAKPVHAKILTELGADKAVDLAQFHGGVSRWQLYDTFFRALADREVGKEARRGLDEKSRLRFLRDVAFWLWTARGGSTALYASELPDDLLEALPNGDASDTEGKKREYLSGSFLEKKSGDIYYFSHRSFAEFLVAQHMLGKPPGLAEHPIYSTLFNEGVAEFLREAPSRSAVADWSKNLSDVRGWLHPDYVDFVAEAHGGIKKLAASLPDNTLWSTVLGVFGTEVIFDEETLAATYQGMRSHRNDVVAVLLPIVQGCLVSCRMIRTSQVRRASEMVAAALLDRVFRVTSDAAEDGRLTISIPEGDDLKSMAAAGIRDVTDYGGDRTFVFSWRTLVERCEDIRSSSGVNFAPRLPIPKTMFEQELRLRIVDVTKLMSPAAGRKAVEYFKRNATFSQVLTVYRTSPVIKYKQVTRRGNKDSRR